MIRLAPSQPTARPPFAQLPDEAWLTTLDLTDIQHLERQGCSSDDWSQVQIDRRTRLSRLREVTFIGQVVIGLLDDDIEVMPGLKRQASLRNVTLQDCVVGNNCFIHNVRQMIARCDIGRRVVIVDLGSLSASGETTFGNGVEVHVLREDGGLVVPIYDGLTSNIAALWTMSHEGEAVREQLTALVARYAESVRGDRCQIGDGASLRGCGELRNVRIGPAAKLNGVARVENCSLLSRNDGEVDIGDGVILVDSIVHAGTSIVGAAQVSRCFVGQGVRIGDQFSAVDSLFFANSEAFRGEACSALVGPYSVSHHKATLMIAMQMSYFNAGAGTTQCNHAYKTGPVHYGVLERGCKTGGSSSVCWPANVGAFSILLGMHRGEFDTRDFPFSTVLEHEGSTRLIPAVNLLRIGPWRDVRKWHSRDRRPLVGRADLLHHEALSPWTVQRMLRARAVLQHLCSSCDGDQKWIEFAGVIIKPRDAKRGLEWYDRAIRRWLAEGVVELLEKGRSLAELCGDPTDISATPDSWFDLGGLFVPERRLATLVAQITNGKIDSVDSLSHELTTIANAFDADVDAWRLQVWRQEFGLVTDDAVADAVLATAQAWVRVSEFFLQSALDDGMADFDTAESWDADRRPLQRLMSDPPATPRRPAPAVLEQLQAERVGVEARANRIVELLRALPVVPKSQTNRQDSLGLARHSLNCSLATPE